MRWTTVIVLVGLVATGCGGSASHAHQGILRVSASAGPTCPVEQLSVPCDPRPVERATLEVWMAGGERIARLDVRNGRAEPARLDAGRYRLVALPADGLLGTPAPVAFTIAAGHTTRLQLTYDTGIR